MLLYKMFGDEYIKNITIKNNAINNDINFYNINRNIENCFGVNKYLVKNKSLNLNNNDEKNETNKYKFVYNPYKKVNGFKEEIKKEDLFKSQEDDIVGSFDFERKHHFA